MSRLSRKERREARKQARQNGTFKGREKLPLFEKLWPAFYTLLHEMKDEYQLADWTIKQVTRDCRRQLRRLLIQAKEIADLSTFFNLHLFDVQNILSFAKVRMTRLEH